MTEVFLDDSDLDIIESAAAKTMSIGDMVDWLESVESAKEAIVEQKKSRDAKIKSLESKIDYIRSEIHHRMLTENRDKVLHGPYTLSLANTNKSRVEILIDADKLPPEDQRITIEADKQALKDDIQKNGVQIDGVSIITSNEPSLMIRKAKAK